MKSKIKLTNAKVSIPTTYDEWVEIHGEPEYETDTTPDSNIVWADWDVTEDEIDTSNIVFYDPRNQQVIDYKKFIDVFAHINKIVYCNGVFYTPDGQVSNQAVRRDIANSLALHGWKSKLDVPTNSLFTSLKDIYSVEELPVNSRVIPLANGDLHLCKEYWVFYLGRKEQSPYRLSVDYNPTPKPMPLFEKWLNDVFYPEDIPTIQEIMGYLLIPSTAAGEAFFIVGDGGAGKSGLGTIMCGLLGNAGTTVDLQEFLSNKFQIASVENKLLAYDDDLGSASLVETALFKKLVTADTRIRAERKHVDSHTFTSYCRILASTNFMLTSLHDNSDGFHRRLHPIVVKRPEPGRKKISKFYEMILAEEKEEIFKWALEGLRRLMANGYKITWSERSKEYLEANKMNSDYFQDFFNEVFVQDAEANTTSAELKTIHQKWCKENGIKEVSDRKLTNWLTDNADQLCVKYDGNLIRNNKRLRGYKGIRIKDEWKNVTIHI